MQIVLCSRAVWFRVVGGLCFRPRICYSVQGRFASCLLCGQGRATGCMRCASGLVASSFVLDLRLRFCVVLVCHDLCYMSGNWVYNILRSLYSVAFLFARSNAVHPIFVIHFYCWFCNNLFGVSGAGVFVFECATKYVSIIFLRRLRRCHHLRCRSHLRVWV